MLLGSEMVARGEIGLVVVEIGLNDTPYLFTVALTTATWAIVMNTVLGSVAVGLMMRYRARGIADGLWGWIRPKRREGTWDGGIPVRILS